MSDNKPFRTETFLAYIQPRNLHFTLLEGLTEYL